MNRIRWVAFCVSGFAILTFTQFPYAATPQTRVNCAAAEVNCSGAIKSNAVWVSADLARKSAK
jgi:hypothetical protein